MASDPELTLPLAKAVLAPPTVAGWQALLQEVGATELCAFSQMELAAAGASSPLKGLVASASFLDLDDREFDEQITAAREGLIRRGLASAPSRGSNPDPTEETYDFKLGGDLAAVTAIRRDPALLGSISVVPVERVERPSNQSAADGVMAVMHGVAAGGLGLFALLEETLTAGAIHYFAIATPRAQAERVVDAYRELLEAAEVAMSVHIYVPDRERPRHTQLALVGEEARMSTDGRYWGWTGPIAGWPEQFEAAVRL